VLFLRSGRRPDHAAEASRGENGCTVPGKHEFQVAEPESGKLLRIGIPDDEGFGTGAGTLPDWTVGVIELVEEAGQAIDYDYDFGGGG